MENNPLNETFKILSNFENNNNNKNYMGENEDPINQIDLSLKKLLLDLKNNNLLMNDYMETIIFKDNKGDNILYDYNHKKYSSNNFYNKNIYENFLIEEEDNDSQDIPEGEYITKKISKKKNSNDRMRMINHNYKTTKKRDKQFSQRNLSSYKKDFNKEKKTFI